MSPISVPEKQPGISDLAPRLGVKRSTVEHDFAALSRGNKFGSLAADVNRPDSSLYRHAVAITDKGTSLLVNGFGNLLVFSPPRSPAATVSLFLESLVEPGFVNHQVVFLCQVLNDLEGKAAGIVKEKRLDAGNGTEPVDLDSPGSGRRNREVPG